MAPGVLIALDGVVAGYDAPVVGPVSFTLHKGEIVGIHGRNGAGKSTLLKVVTGTARVFDGSVYRAPGLAISHQEQGAPDLAELPLCGDELISLTGAQSRDLPEWIAPRRSERLSRLSGGELQFLRLWACLTAPADVVVLDEPTNNLDRRGIAYLERSLAALERDKGVMVVSHDLRFVRTVCRELIELPE